MNLKFLKVRRLWNIPETLLLLEIPNVPIGRSTDHHRTLDVLHCHLNMELSYVPNLTAKYIPRADSISCIYSLRGYHVMNPSICNLAMHRIVCLGCLPLGLIRCRFFPAKRLFCVTGIHFGPRDWNLLHFWKRLHPSTLEMALASGWKERQQRIIFPFSQRNKINHGPRAVTTKLRVILPRPFAPSITNSWGNNGPIPALWEAQCWPRPCVTWPSSK